VVLFITEYDFDNTVMEGITSIEWRHVYGSDITIYDTKQCPNEIQNG
jgi:hypothetical protein